MGDDFKLDFSFNPQNQLKPIKYSLVFYVAALVSLIYFMVKNEVVGLYIAGGFTLVILPQIIIHLQYFLNDRKLMITVNHSKRSLMIQKHKRETFDFSDIVEIIRYKGQRNENSTAYALPFSYYNHSEIRLKDGRSFLFTDFITPNLGIKQVPKSENFRFLNFLDLS